VGAVEGSSADAGAAQHNAVAEAATSRSDAFEFERTITVLLTLEQAKTICRVAAEVEDLTGQGRHQLALAAGTAAPNLPVGR
jgi:hypothetical protein